MNVLTGLLNLLSVFLLVYFGFGVFGAMVGYTLSFFVVAIFGVWMLYSPFYTQLSTSESTHQDLARRIFEYNLALSVTSGARAIEKQADILMIGFFLSPVSVGLYTASKQVTSTLSAPAAALGFTLSPMYSEEKHSGETKNSARLYSEAFKRVLLLYLPGVTGLIINAQPTINYLFGSEYIVTVPVLQVLALVGLLEAIGSITSNGLDYLGKAKRRAQLKLVAVFLNVGLNILLINRYGIVGAAIRTVIAYAIYISGTVSIMQH
jgi:O-antigen/teichoic acid export membrane protein